MAYCRFSNGDVYLYFHVNGFIECCCCRLTTRRRHAISQLARRLYHAKKKFVFLYQDVIFYSRFEAIKHLADHRKVEHRVGYGATASLKRERARVGDQTSITKEKP